MTIALIASASLGGVLPGAAALNVTSAAALDAELVAALALLADLQTELPALELEAKAAANLSAQLEAQLNVDPAATIAASLAFAGDAQVALAANLSGPAFTAELAVQVVASASAAADLAAKVIAKASAIAAVGARIGALRAAIAVTASFGTDLDAAGIRIYLYTGPLKDLGLAVDAYLQTPEARDNVGANVSIYAPLIITDNPTSFAAMQRVFKLSP